MKTLREEIIELLMERIGVVENEEFKGKGINGKYHNFKFAYGELLIKYNDKWHNTMLGGFIEDFEDYEFKKKPFKPKDGETYFYVDTDGVIIDAIFLRHRILDVLNRHTRNCFTTEKEACLHRDEMLKILKGESDE